MQHTCMCTCAYLHTHTHTHTYRVGPRRQIQEAYMRELEAGLLEHPLGLYPHLKEAIAPKVDQQPLARQLKGLETPLQLVYTPQLTVA